MLHIGGARTALFNYLFARVSYGSVSEWIPPKKQRALRKDKNYTERLELIQDLRLPNATSKIKATPDGEYLIASGIYPLQIKVYELRELAVKFERHLDYEIIDFQFDGFIDLDSYDTIALKLKGDGRSYISTIPLSRYMPTWRGSIINANTKMNPGRVVGMSLSVNAEGGVPGATTGPGDFKLELDWIKALRTD